MYVTVFGPALLNPLTDPLLPDTAEQKKRFADKPDLFLKYSKMIESELNVRFKFILNGTPEAEGAKEVCVVDLG